MKYFSVLFLFFIATYFYAAAVSESDRINSLLDSWHQAATVADEKIYFDLMDQDAVFIGTDPAEYWIKEDFRQWAEPYFKRSSAWVFQPQKRNIYLSADGETAWFDEILLSANYGICRGSGVLVKKNNQWLIKHYVLSFAIPNDKVKAVMNLLREEN